MSTEEYKHVTTAGLETIARGEIVKQVDRQLQKAVDSCLDPNTDPKASRTVTLKIQIKPNDQRDGAAVSYAVDLKLPSDAKGSDQLFIRRRDGRAFVPKGEQLGLEAAVADLNRKEKTS